MAKHSICFFGDDVLLGMRDPEGAGWAHRLARAEREHGHALISYVLGVEGDTTLDVARRWREESEVRLTGLPSSALVFCFGLNDLAADEDGVRISLPEILSHAEHMMAEAAAWRAAFWIGPPPVVHGGVSARSRSGQDRFYDAVRIRGLSQGFSTVASKVGVPFLDLCAVLDGHMAYVQALREGNGILPGHSGQAILASVIGGWGAWREWLDHGVAPNLYFAP